MLVTSTTAKGNKNEETREGIAGLAAHKLELNSTLLGRRKTSPITHFMWNQILPMGLKSRPSVGGQLHYRLLWLALKHPRLYSGPFLKLIIFHPIGSCRLLCLVGWRVSVCSTLFSGNTSTNWWKTILFFLFETLKAPITVVNATAS